MTAGQGIYGGRKVREGTVVSDKMEKTVVVAVASAKLHPLYKKTIRRVTKYMAHDENEVAKTGDRVRIVEATPISKRKRWRVAEVLSHLDLAELAPEAIDSTLIEELAAPIEPPAPRAKRAAAEADIEPVQADAGLEALESNVMSEADAAPMSAPEVPSMEQEEVVQADAGLEALEPEGDSK